MKQALAKFESLWEIGIDAEYKVELLPEIRMLRQAIEQAEKKEPRKEWVGLTDDDWGQLWQDFEDACDELEVAYQEEAQKKHGEGHYYISSEDQWEYDKRTIRDLVEAKLKEKNGDTNK
jgi:hypothetical protein